MVKGQNNEGIMSRTWCTSTPGNTLPWGNQPWDRPFILVFHHHDTLFLQHYSHLGFSGYSCAGFLIWKSTTLKTVPYIVTNNQHHPHFFPQISAYLIAIFILKVVTSIFRSILVGRRHLQPQENIYIQRNNFQESPNGGKITIFFLELRLQRLLLVSENIFSQNIFLPRTQGPDMKNIFLPTIQGPDIKNIFLPTTQGSGMKYIFWGVWHWWWKYIL